MRLDTSLGSEFISLRLLPASTAMLEMAVVQ